MTWQDLTVNIFLDTVSSMPDIEAKEQIELRKDRAVLELGVIDTALQSARKEQKTQLGLERAVICTDLSRLNRALKEVNERMSRIGWGRAVTAIFGHEGYEQCRIWMEANREG